LRKNILNTLSEKSNGFTLIEVLVSILVLTFILFSLLFVFKGSVINFRKKTTEKDIYKNTTEVFETLGKYLKNAKVNNLKGNLRMNFKGGKNWIKFISITEESEESDFLKVGLYFQDNKIKMSLEKVDEKRKFHLRDGFPGAQVLAENIENFEISYFDGKNYVSGWDTEKMEIPFLPSFVKIKIVPYGEEKIEGKVIKKEFERILKVGYE